MSNTSSTGRALSAVVNKIGAVESALKELDALNERKLAIDERIKAATNEEKCALVLTDDDAAVKSLITARALVDVHGTRLVDITAKIALQEDVVLEAGKIARQFALEVAQLLEQSRHDRALDHIEETFVDQPVEATFLATFDKTVIQAKEWAGSFGSSYLGDHETEIASLRQLGAHFEPVAKAVKSDGTELSIPDSWLEPKSIAVKQSVEVPAPAGNKNGSL